jgi:ribosomal protein S18 acetylase RimI-like enzyme
MLRIERLTERDVVGYQEIRLEGLRAHPESFGASFEEEEAQSLSSVGERLAGSIVLGGYDNDCLQGVIGLYVPGRIKQRHKGTVWGMYVREQARRRGLGAALLARLLREARSVVEEVRLTVVTTNTSAIRLYQRAGFQPYGVERRALKVSESYHDEMLMTLSAAGLHGA